MVENSVFQLITSLCSSLATPIQQNKSHSRDCQLRKWHALAFEILLNKTSEPIRDTAKCAFPDPLKELMFQFFMTCIMNGKSPAQNKSDFECLEAIGRAPFFTTDTGRSFLTFILALGNGDMRDIKEYNRTKYLTRHSGFLPAALSLCVRPELSQSISPNPYVPSFGNGSGVSFALQTRYGSRIKQPIVQLAARKKSKAPVLERAVLIRPPETIPSLLDILCVHARQQGRKFPVRVVTKSKLIQDVKFLVVGVRSESFTFDQTFAFSMLSTLSVEDIAPSTIALFITEFLEYGTCFKRLQQFIARNMNNVATTGFIMNALCSAVDKILLMFRKFVTNFDDCNLVELSKRISSVGRQIVSIAVVLKVYPNVEPLVKGSQFLGYLYEQIKRSNRKEATVVLMFILKTCCTVYFKEYHKWIFHGVLEDNYKELFISYVDLFRPNTKYFFDKAYTIKKECVPGFLEGLQKDILLCGKYTMLLKAYKPTHYLFANQAPELRICLTSSELENLQQTCNNYRKHTYELSYEIVSIKEKIIEKHDSRNEFYVMIENKHKLNLIKWKEEQEVKADEIRKEKQSCLDGWMQQIEERKRDKVALRQATLQEDRRLMLECQRMDDIKLKKDNIERQKRCLTYLELSKLTDELTIGNALVDEHTIASTVGKMVRSKSDCMNANETDENQMPTELARNKLKVLGSTINQTVEESIKASNNCLEHDGEDENQMPTELARNKLKVLGSTINQTVEESIEASNNCLEHDGELTDAQRNKIKILGHYDCTSDTPSEGVRTLCVDEQMTDLQKNRLKMMKHDLSLDLLPNKYELPKVAIDVQVDPISDTPSTMLTASFVDTPMSLGSDFDQTTSDDYITITSPCSTTVPINDDLNLPLDVVDQPELCAADTGVPLNVVQPFVARTEAVFFVNNFNRSSHSEYRSRNKSKMEEHNITTLTHYLRMSIAIPLNVQMSLLNNEMLKMYLDDLNIVGHFGSLRNYFLLMDGEFASYICDGIISKIKRNVRPHDVLNFQVLQILLENGLRSSITGSDKNAECLSFTVTKIPDEFDCLSPNALDCLSLSYNVTWPLSLILNPETLNTYATIFKYLLKVRRISWLLEDSFQYLRRIAKTNGPSMLQSPEYGYVQKIRHKLSHFVNALQNHITSNGLQVSWKKFTDNLETVQSMQDIYQKHTTYVKRILFLCMLNRRSIEFNKTVEDIFKVVLRFTHRVNDVNWFRPNAKEPYTHPSFEKLLKYEHDFDKLIKYTIYLGKKIVSHGYQLEIGEFIDLININGYYV